MMTASKWRGQKMKSSSPLLPFVCGQDSKGVLSQNTNKLKHVFTKRKTLPKYFYSVTKYLISAMKLFTVAFRHSRI